MKSQYEVERMKYSDLEGSVAVPQYQRKLVWSDGQKQRFIDNISKGFPFGSILLYRYEGETKLSLIDGLQRFSTLREYQNQPAKYFDEYGPFLKSALDMIEEGNNIELSDSQIMDISEKLKIIFRKCLEQSDDDDDAMFFIRDCVRNDLAIFPSGREYDDALAILQRRLKIAASDYLDLDDLVIPCVVFTGEENQLPDVFANINQGGTKLSKYQVLAAHWTRYDFSLPESDQCNRILDSIIDRYQYLQDARELEIIGFDSSDMEDNRKINLSEYCYALGELIIQETPVFWGSVANADSEKREDTSNVIGYLTTAIALGVDNRTIGDLPGKISLFRNSEFVEQFTDLILKEYKVIQNLFGDWLRVPGVSEKVQYESSAITDMQALSFFASLWHKHYLINEEAPCIETIEHYRDKGYDQVKRNLVSHCVADVVSKAWQGSGDSRLANYYVKNAEAPNSYYPVLSEEALSTRLINWHEEITSKPSITPEKASKMLLCIFSAPNRVMYTENRYDIEHVIAKQKLKQNNIYTTSVIPGGTLGNLMYLKERTNRGKKSRNLYALMDHEGLEFRKEYLQMTLYPDRTIIDTAEMRLEAGDAEQAKQLIINRGKGMITEIAKSLSN